LRLDTAVSEELFPYILGRCDHDPERDDAAALCDACQNVFVVLVDRVTETDEPLH